MMPGDDYDLGPGYWDDGKQDELDDAFTEGAKSRDLEVELLTGGLENAQDEVAYLKARLAFVMSAAAALGIVFPEAPVEAAAAE